MSKRILFRTFLVALLLVSLFAGISGADDELKKKNSVKQDQDKVTKKDDDKKKNVSVMDKLREKITGLSSTGFQIISSGSTKTSDEWITITENAELAIGSDKRLLADVIKFNPSENLLKAEGNVVLLENNLRLGGDSLDLNLNDNTGEVTNPYIESEGGYIIAGDKLIKLGPDEYELTGARITTCNQPTPHWVMAASSVKFKAGESATLRNLRMNILGKVPVFYTPWMSIPLDKTKRKSGLLMPKWGHSEYHGWDVTTRYFLAINDQHDATLGLDWYEERGTRYSLEYRNNLGDGNITNIYGYYIADKLFYSQVYGDNWEYWQEQVPETKDRFNVRIRNKTNLPANFKAIVDVEFLSDSRYRTEFVNRWTYVNPFFRKNVELRNDYREFSFSASYNDIDRFIGWKRISQIRYLPRIDFKMREMQVADSPVFVTLAGNYLRPELREIIRRADRGLEDQVVEGKDVSYDRYDMSGKVLVPIKKYSPWFTITPHMLGRYTDYSKSITRSANGQVARDKQGNIIYQEEGVSRKYYDFGIDMIGPVFSKVFGDKTSSRNLFKHVIEPKLTYLYRSDFGAENQRAIIILDQEDNIFRVNELRWTLSSTLFHKRNYLNSERQGTVNEVFKVAVSQFVTLEDGLLNSYDKRYVYDPTLVETSAINSYSPLLVSASARIFGNLSLRGDMEYDMDENMVLNYNLGASLQYAGSRYDISWMKRESVIRFDRPGTFSSSTNRIIQSGNLNLFDGMINLTGQIDYNFSQEDDFGNITREGDFLSWMAGASISGQCLGASFEVRKLNFAGFGSDDLQTRWNITISGLGDILGGGRD